MKTYTLLILAIIFIAASCNKDPKPNGDFVRCKVDGQSYKPDNCTNCTVCRIIRDTTFTFGINRGIENVGLGLNDPIGISVKAYILNDNFKNQGTYDNTIFGNDEYKTDPIHIGSLHITILDKVKKKIEGTFSFIGFSPAQNKTVNITDGEFRLTYTTN
ncbi:MAG: DUF6252 family protein [Ginsengibacter sp.]